MFSPTLVNVYLFYCSYHGGYEELSHCVLTCISPVAKMLSIFFVLIGCLYFFRGQMAISVEFLKILLPHLSNVASRTKLERTRSSQRE